MPALEVRNIISRVITALKCKIYSKEGFRSQRSIDNIDAIVHESPFPTVESLKHKPTKK